MPDFPSPLTSPVLRDDLPRYPIVLQLLRVTATTVPGPAGVAQLAGSSVLGPLLYVAFTQQLRTDALLPRDREPCLADDVNNIGLTPGFYLARLGGSFNSLPVYEVATVASGGGALTVVYSDGTNPVPNVTRIEMEIDDFTISSSAPGIVLIRTRGFTGNRLICDAAGAGGAGGYLPYVWRRGLLKTVS